MVSLNEPAMEWGARDDASDDEVLDELWEMLQQDMFYSGGNSLPSPDLIDLIPDRLMPAFEKMVEAINGTSPGEMGGTRPPLDSPEIAQNNYILNRSEWNPNDPEQAGWRTMASGERVFYNGQGDDTYTDPDTGQTYEARPSDFNEPSWINDATENLSNALNASPKNGTRHSNMGNDGSSLAIHEGAIQTPVELRMSFAGSVLGSTPAENNGPQQDHGFSKTFESFDYG